MYKFNENPELPSLSAMQGQVLRAKAQPLAAGYKCHTGHILTELEAQALNHYIETALEEPIFNDQERLNGVLDRKHRTFVMIAEEHEYIVGIGYVPKLEAEQIRNAKKINK